METDKPMRILIATTHTIPAFSGGWTTPLDLLGTDHQAMYVIRNFPPVKKTVEGVRVVGVGVSPGFSKEWSRYEKYRVSGIKKLYKRTLQREFSRFKADFILCLDPEAGLMCLSAGLPYALRFHTAVSPGLTGKELSSLLSNALFSTACQRTNVPGVEVLPHNQDLSRFKYIEHPRAERAVLLTGLNPVREPELFIDGIMASKTMKGDIIGTGPLESKIVSLCRKTNGRVRKLSPVSRLIIPEVLSNYQVGVATIKKVPVHYQMKINSYMASGLFTLAKPWTHVVEECPQLVRTYVTAEELAEQLNWLSENWDETLETRREARKWIHENYSVDIPRKRFNEILEETFGSLKN